MKFRLVLIAALACLASACSSVRGAGEWVCVNRCNTAGGPGAADCAAQCRDWWEKDDGKRAALSCDEALL